jgi:uncharacterized protein YcbK (DUF882 family)
MAARWVKSVKPGKAQYRDGFRDVTVVAINHGERQRLFLFDAKGNLTPEALQALSRLMRDKDTQEEHAVEPRLVKLMYRLAEHFKVHQFNLVSGFRSSSDPYEESQHNKGLAADIAMPGVPLVALARKARTLGHVGVGIYPVSGFVHLDVREGPSYFWVDPSGPGRRACFRPFKSDVGPKADRKWKPCDDEPVPKRDPGGNLLGATEPETPLETPVGDQIEAW